MPLRTASAPEVLLFGQERGNARTWWPIRSRTASAPTGTSVGALLNWGRSARLQGEGETGNRSRGWPGPCRRYESRDGLGRAKQDAGAESTNSRRLGRRMEQLPRRYESMDGRGRAKHDARAESTKSRRPRRCREQLPRNARTGAVGSFAYGAGTCRPVLQRGFRPPASAAAAQTIARLPRTAHWRPRGQSPGSPARPRRSAAVRT